MEKGGGSKLFWLLKMEVHKKGQLKRGEYVILSPSGELLGVGIGQIISF